jgi:secondary thiamine-phosphate synthase enzyme
MIEKFSIETHRSEELVDITSKVEAIVQRSGVKNGICFIYTPHATAAVTINENADPNIAQDILAALDNMVSRDISYSHDRIDNNASAHIKSSLIHPGASIPVSNQRLTLGRWQDIFFCEFDGPRAKRDIIVTVIKDD